VSATCEIQEVPRVMQKCLDHATNSGH